jgi:hypothetical protein
MTILKGEEILYEELAEDLFPETVEGGQQLVPFLGAGVSISARTFSEPSREKPKTPDNNSIEKALADLDLGARGKTLVTLAIKLAYMIEKEAPPASPEDFLRDLQDSDYPPSASELAQLFSLRSRYQGFAQFSDGLQKLFESEALPGSDTDQLLMLTLLARVTRIANPPEPLTSLASYYEERRGREKLWKLLSGVMSRKERPTETHRLFARAAQHHLNRGIAKDYLIITTNYDSLMEIALNEFKVPYIVLTTKRKDPKVIMRCSSLVTQQEDLMKLSDCYYPIDFSLDDKPQKLVVIYKIHGCLSKESEFSKEGLVISDNDYVDFVSQMSKLGVIPAHVSDLMLEKPMWFLGYSLSDWNVRSIYETIKSKCNPDGKKLKDYSVMYSVGIFESLFFEKNDITILQASLNEFVAQIMKHLPDWVKQEAA